jgi:anti-anti-sigma factor
VRYGGAAAAEAVHGTGMLSRRVEMERTDFHVEVQRNGSTLFLSLAGEFDSTVTDEVAAVVEGAYDVPLEHVVFDLSGLTFIDISALKVILKAHERAPSYGYQLTVVRPRGLANRIFTLTRAAETLEIVDRV